MSTKALEDAQGAGLGTAFHDPERLKVTQYRDGANLDVRSDLHDRFGTSRVSWYDWVLDQLELSPSTRAQILDIGCGTGRLWLHTRQRLPRNWHITLADISPGMLAEVRRNCRPIAAQCAVTEADVERMPFPSGQFHAVIANHMLYHTRDLDAALKEIKRVLRPGGRLYASTVGPNHMMELHEWVSKVGVRFLADTVGEFRAFRLDTGMEALRRHFSSVRMVEFEDDLVVTEVEPLVAYLRSCATPEQLDEEAEERCRQLFRRMLQDEGDIRIAKETGLFVAVKTKPGERDSMSF